VLILAIAPFAFYYVLQSRKSRQRDVSVGKAMLYIALLTLVIFFLVGPRVLQYLYPPEYDVLGECVRHCF